MNLGLPQAQSQVRLMLLSWFERHCLLLVVLLLGKVIDPVGTQTGGFFLGGGGGKGGRGDVTTVQYQAFQLIASSYQPSNHNRSPTPLLASCFPSSLGSRDDMRTAYQFLGHVCPVLEASQNHLWHAGHMAPTVY